MSNQRTGEYDFVAAGWGLTVDADGNELRLEHIESAAAYVFDGDGNLTIPSADAPAGAMRDLQETLAAALEGDDQAQTGSDGASASGCAVECDQATGEVTIRSQNAITLDAPQIDVTSTGNANIDAEGVLSLTGSLIELN